MASPDGLRLYFGKHAPADVLDLIFSYGFHLWLAKPVDVFGSEWYHPDYELVHAGRAVLARSLSKEARRLVRFEEYYWNLRADDGTPFDQCDIVHIEYARPRVYPKAMPIRGGGALYFANWKMLRNDHYIEEGCGPAASPDGLRLYLGNRLPTEVLENIFSYGFHLWLAKPVDVCMHEPDRYPSRLPGTAVLARSLTAEARRLVEFDRYYWNLEPHGWCFTFDAGDIFRVEYARPWVFHDAAHGYDFVDLHALRSPYEIEE